MGAQSFITCDRCGERTENSYAKVREPVGWGTVLLMVCKHRPHATVGDPDKGLDRASKVGDLCPACLEAVRAVVEPRNVEKGERIMTPGEAREREDMRLAASKALHLHPPASWEGCLARMAELTRAEKEESTAAFNLYQEHLDEVATLLRMPGSPTWKDCMARLGELAKRGVLFDFEER